MENRDMFDLEITQQLIDEKEKIVNDLALKLDEAEKEYQNKVLDFINSIYNNDNIKIELINFNIRSWKCKLLNSDSITFFMESPNEHERFYVEVFKDKISINNDCLGTYTKDSLYFQALKLITLIFDNDSKLIDIANSFDREMLIEFEKEGNILSEMKRKYEFEKRKREEEKILEPLLENFKNGAVYGEYWKEKPFRYFKIKNITNKNVVINRIGHYGNNEFEYMFKERNLIDIEDFKRNLINNTFRFLEFRDMEE